MMKLLLQKNESHTTSMLFNQSFSSLAHSALKSIVTALVLLASTQTSIKTTAANQSPHIHVDSGLSVTAGQTIETSFQVDDPEFDDCIIYFNEGQGLPEGANFDPRLNTIQWTPTREQVGVHIISIHAFDGSNTFKTSISIEVLNPLMLKPEVKVEKLIQRSHYQPIPGQSVIEITPAVIKNIGSIRVNNLTVEMMCYVDGVEHNTKGKLIEIGNISAETSSDRVNDTFEIMFSRHLDRKTIQVELYFLGTYQFFGVQKTFSQVIPLEIGRGANISDFGGYNRSTPVTLIPEDNGKLVFAGVQFASYPENPWNPHHIIPVEFHVGAMSKSSKIVGTGHLDNDGLMDLVVADPMGDLYFITWERNETGNLGEAVQRNMRVERMKNGGIGREFLGLADYNGDGYCDIYTKSFLTNQIIVINYADGEIKNGVWSSWTHNANNDLEFKGFGDFNNDGRDDILWQNTQNRRFLLWYYGDSEVYLNVVGDKNNATMLLAIADTDGDGTDEAILGWAEVPWVSRAYLIQDTGYQSGFATINFDQWEYIGQGDFNGDGLADLVFVNQSKRTQLRYCYGNSNHSTQIVDTIISKSLYREFAAIPRNIFGTVGVRFYGNDICDYDGDGKSEIIVRQTLGAGKSYFAITPERVFLIE